MLEEEEIFRIGDVRYQISNFYFNNILSITILSIDFDFVIGISPLRRIKLVKIFVVLITEG
jgi:hypothetical protein